MAQARHSSEKMERTDSGFGDILDAPSKPLGSTQHSTSTSSNSKAPPQHRSKSYAKPARPTTRHRSNTQPTCNPLTSQRLTSTRHNSTSSSSFILPHHDTTPTNTPFSSLCLRSRSKSHTHSLRSSETQDPYAFHAQCKSLFSPSPSTHPLPPSPTSSTSPTTTSNIETPPPPHQTIATTTTYWLLPSTRRREYAEIESLTRGLRGLWRKVVPRRWRREGRVGFFERKGDGDKGVDDGDGGSVRRYRIDVDEGEEDDEKEGVREKRVCGWRCFGKSE